MGTLRRHSRALRSLGFFYYFFDQNHLRQGVIAYRREAPADGPLPAESLIVVLNFSDRDAEAEVPPSSSRLNGLRGCVCKACRGFFDPRCSH
jgi:hypothetical protein